MGAGRHSPSIIHLDMDAFFVAVETLDAPELRGRSVIVGGLGNRGVVAAASYEARAWGVHSAMPMAIARRRCPDAVFLPGRHSRYREVSLDVHRILDEATPYVEPVALDEAFLDVRGVRRLHGDAYAIARNLRARIADELGLACSVGVAPRKLTAKLASEAAKPRPSRDGVIPGPGVVVIFEEDELSFLHGHQVRALWGVGPATEKRLGVLGVKTVGDLARLPEATLVKALGPSAGSHLHALAWARDHRLVAARTSAGSIGHEETYPHDIVDRSELEREVLRLSDAVAHRMRKSGMSGGTVTLKVRFGDFRTITRSVTPDEPVADGLVLTNTARTLLEGVSTDVGVRLLGVSVSKLAKAAEVGVHQMRLGEDAQPFKAAEVIDLIRDRFGDDAIVPATLVNGSRGRSDSSDRSSPRESTGGIRIVRTGDQHWGPDSSSASIGDQDSR